MKRRIRPAKLAEQGFPCGEPRSYVVCRLFALEGDGLMLLL
jgi:hypothetical protein